ncbi:hybrid sensor histidine kinase/response regulator [Isosphaeraceae bacterium EP7]
MTTSSVAILVVRESKDAEADRSIDAIRDLGFNVIDAAADGETFGLLRSTAPSVLVYVEPASGGMPGGVKGEPGESLLAQARSAKIPVLAVVFPGGAPERLDHFDDFVLQGAEPEEVVTRLRRLIARRDDTLASSSLDPNFLAVVVHDLRTPLNAMGLAIQVLEHVLGRKAPDLDEDLRCIRVNSAQMEKMLAQLSDYCRIGMMLDDIRPVPFDPRRLAEEIIEKWQSKMPAPAPRVDLEIDATCPVEASLDQTLVGQAIFYSLSNAAGAISGDTPIRLRLSGEGGGQDDADRWVVSIAVDQPPPSYVEPITLHPRVFERLNGVAAERRGLDLAVAAWVSQLLGGNARLDVAPGHGTTIVLDWPARSPSSED